MGHFSPERPFPINLQFFRQQKTLSFSAQSLLAKMRWHWPKKALAALGKQQRTEENPLKVGIHQLL
jgi:hypothetical protein